MSLLIFPAVAFVMLAVILSLAGVRRPLAWTTLTFSAGFFIVGGSYASQAAAAEPRCEATVEQATELFGHPPMDLGGLAGGPIVPCRDLTALGFKGPAAGSRQVTPLPAPQPKTPACARGFLSRTLHERHAGAAIDRRCQGPTIWPARLPTGAASRGASEPGNASRRARVSCCAAGSLANRRRAMAALTDGALIFGRPRQAQETGR
jgi:hypothetical protein